MLFITMNHLKNYVLQRRFPYEESELCSQDAIYPCSRHHTQDSCAPQAAGMSSTFAAPIIGSFLPP